MINFQSLWDNHPTISDEAGGYPCQTDGNVNFANQCAIRLGRSLVKSGLDPSKMAGLKMCWHHTQDEGHVLLAEDLAKWLKRTVIPGVKTAEEYPGKDFASKISGHRGIIFFKDYWAREGETHGNGTGDHIDLWNGSRLTDWKSWVRIQLNISIPGIWSDFEESKKVVFWRMS